MNNFRKSAILLSFFCKRIHHNSFKSKKAKLPACKLCFFDRKKSSDASSRATTRESATSADG